MSQRRRRSSQKTSWDDRLVFLLLSALLFLAPIVRGGNREMALFVLLALALGCAALLLAQATRAQVLRQPAPWALEHPPGRWWLLAIGLLVTSPLWLGLLQLWPLPADWWRSLAGRAPYLEALQAAGLTTPDNLPLTLNPQATQAALWSAIPLCVVFWLALCLPQKMLEQLFWLLLLAGAAQVLLAVAQFATGAQSVLYFGRTGQGLIGSFANRNHLADFLAMLLPLWFYMWQRLQRNGHEDFQAQVFSSKVVRKPLLLLLGFAFLIIILSTQSRGGILSATAVLVLSALLYSWAQHKQLKTWQRWALPLLLLLLVALALASVDIAAILARVEQGRLQTDAQVRNTIAQATWQAGQVFWPWGSGLGSFESVFPRFQPTLTPNYVNHAHNDYSQIFMELGAPGLLLALVFLLLVLRQIRALWLGLRQGSRLSSDLALRLFAGLGGLAMLLHSWVEFNMHIPALAITTCFLWGVFLRPLPPAKAGSNRHHA